MAGHVTPMDPVDVLNLLTHSSEIVGAGVGVVSEATGEDRFDTLEFLTELLSSLAHDVEQGDLAVGRCDSCPKIHVWRPSVVDEDEGTVDAGCAGPLDDNGYCVAHGFKNIGTASTDNGMLAIVAPYFATTLGEWWNEYLDKSYDAMHQFSVETSHEIKLEQTTYKATGPEHGYRDTQWAMLVNCDNGLYDVDARYCDRYGDGHMSICELRIDLHQHHLDVELDDEVDAAYEND